LTSTDEKLNNFINLLYARTYEGKIIWSQTSVFGVYKVTLTSLHTIEVGCRFIKIYDPCGTLIEDCKNHSGIADLYSIAKRQALKVSERLDQLLKFLDAMA